MLGRDDPGACLRGSAYPCRRHDRAGHGQEQDPYRSIVDVWAGRPALAGPDPPAVVFFYSRDRGSEHPEQHLASYTGLKQSDTYARSSQLHEVNRRLAPIVEAACWAHRRCKLFDLARINKAPIGVEAVKHIDAMFVIEREIVGITRKNACVSVLSALGRSSLRWRPDCASSGQGSQEQRQSDRLQPQALGALISSFNC